LVTSQVLQIYNSLYTNLTPEERKIEFSKITAPVFKKEYERRLQEKQKWEKPKEKPKK
jgi:hypothetical protein